MKKIILAFALFCSVAVGYSQSRAIGARLGGDLEFSYQHIVSTKNMLDCTAGLSIGSNHFSVNATVIYDWVFNIKGGWNWYVGPGGGIGVGIYNSETDIKVPLRVSVGGQIGIEYQFGIPLNLSLDYRPMFNVISFANGGYDSGSWFGIALGIRYRFK